MNSNNHKIIAPERLRDVLITKTAIINLQSESVVEKVISFQFKEAIQMLKIVHEVELSGFGKFMISQSKLKKRINKVELAITNVSNLLIQETTSEEKKKDLERKLRDSNVVLAYLKSKINRYEV